MKFNYKLSSMAVHYKFNGRIVPESTSACIVIPQKSFNSKNIEGKYSLIIINSLIDMDIISNDQISDVDAVSICKLLSSNIIVGISFQICAHFHFVIDRVVSLNDARIFNFGVAEPIFINDDDCYLFKRIKDHAPVEEYSHDFRLRRAMTLATLAIAMPYDTPVFCRMAIELIARSMMRNVKEKIDWKPIQEKLHLCESSLKSTNSIAAKIRHGETCETTWSERQKLLEYTWEVVHRYNLYVTNSIPSSIKKL